jgi:hypothetical protein
LIWRWAAEIRRGRDKPASWYKRSGVAVAMNGGEELTSVSGKWPLGHGSARGSHGEREREDEGELTMVLFVDQDGVEVARSSVGRLGYGGDLW